MAGTDFRQIEQLTQEQRQQQRLTAQQMLVVDLLQLSVQEMEERIKTEVEDNPALESDTFDEHEMDDSPEGSDNDADTDGPEELDGCSMGPVGDVEYESDDDDDSSDYKTPRSSEEQYRREQTSDADFSFFDLLKEQLGEQPLTEHQQAIGLWLIGSLDDDGLLRKSLEELVEVMAFRAELYTDVKELEEVLHIIQQFDPAGVGACSLQECLLLQLERKDETPSVVLQRRILTECFDEFSSKRWDRLPALLGTDDAEVTEALQELVRLNPHPGSSLSESVGRGGLQVVPDFVIDGEDDHLCPMLNNDQMLELHVSGEYRKMLKEQVARGRTKADKEAAQFLQQKIDSAESFIAAVKQREETLLTVMRTIVKLQEDFFRTGDESLLKPMILQDVEDASGYDISTISRISTTKSIETRYGIYPLKFFFKNRRVKVGGEESDTYVNTQEVLTALRALIDEEDKHAPYSDERLAALLRERGFAVARRTVAKYRDQLSIPVAKMRVSAWKKA